MAVSYTHLVFDIASISDDVNFEGDATGTAYASGVFKKPIMNTRLFIKNLHIHLLFRTDIITYQCLYFISFIRKLNTQFDSRSYQHTT